MEKFETLNNEQKELVKYWIRKFAKDQFTLGLVETPDSFIEKHLTPEPVIEVGKWYKGNNNRCKKALFFCTGFNNSSKPLGYGFDVYGDWCDLDDVTWTSEVTEATLEEVEQRLIEEAKRIGFVKGAKIKGIGINKDISNVCNSPINGNFKFFSDSNILDSEYGTGHVFNNGKWAEIIDEKSELRETIAKLRAELSTLEAQL